jgi:oligosaccharide reducing-end xylanase
MVGKSFDRRPFCIIFPTMMKTGILFAPIVALAALPVFAGPVAAPYQIGRWEGFRTAAISYTFDDDLPNQYAIAVPMFNAKGFKLTLFTVTSWIPNGSWSRIQAAAQAGHEIASHTVTHPNLTGVTATQLTNELANSQAAINANVAGQKCLTLAYPYCAEPSDAVTATYYIAARTCSGQLVAATPGNFMSISSYVCGSQGSINTAQAFNNLANRAAASGSWCVYLIHALDSDNGYSPLASSNLQASVDYLSTNQAKFWVETFGHVVRYIKERDATAVTETANTGDRITLQVTNNLDRSIYNVPITLRRPLPANWPAAAVVQNNAPIIAPLVNTNSTNYVMFDVVPNGGDVTLTKTALPSVLSPRHSSHPPT